MEIALIAATDKNRGLGYKGVMQWQGGVPSDMKRFRELTTGHTVVMGRKTFAAMGRALPKRRNIVITRDFSGRHDGAECFTSAETAIASCLLSEASKVFIIGGGEIYSLFLPRAERMYITLIDAVFDADTYFPAFNADEWSLAPPEVVLPSEKDKYGMEFRIYERKER